MDTLNEYLGGFDDFDTQVQCDELDPFDGSPLTADEWFELLDGLVVMAEDSDN